MRIWGYEHEQDFSDGGALRQFHGIYTMGSQSATRGRHNLDSIGRRWYELTTNDYRERPEGRGRNQKRRIRTLELCFNKIKSG